MKLSLRVDVDGHFFHGGACRDIPEMVQQCFEPMKTCDDAMSALISRDKSYDQVEANVIMKTRVDAANMLAKELAEMIVHEMKKCDTHNGYKVEEQH